MSRIPWARLRDIGKPVLVFPPIVVALLLLLWFVKNRSEPELQPETEVARVLSVVDVSRFDVRPKVEGFGTSKYSRSWRAVSEVAGRLIHIHPELRPGSVILKDAVLFRIDDQDYKSAVNELQAAIEQTTANVDQLDKTRENYDGILAIENQSLVVFQSELTRIEELQKQNAASQADADVANRAVLAQRLKIQDIENSKRLIEPQRRAYEATIRQTTAKLEQAKRDVLRTEVIAPFAMRVGDVQLESGQFVGKNETLFEGYSVQMVEIETQISVRKVPRLFREDVEDSSFSIDSFTMDMLRSLFDVDIVIRNPAANPGAVWQGEFLRIREEFDAQTRTIGIVVGVENPMEAQPSRGKPPLIQGAFCDVVILGPVLANRVVVPQHAIRDSGVFVIDAENRLRQRVVSVAFSQDGYSVVNSGLDGGERILISDPTPAIEGMLVDPVTDNDAMRGLNAVVGESIQASQQ